METQCHPVSACSFFFFLTRKWSQTLNNCVMESTIAVLFQIWILIFFYAFSPFLVKSTRNVSYKSRRSDRLIFLLSLSGSHDVQPYRCPGLRSFRKFASSLAILVGDVGLGGRNRRRGGSSTRREGVVFGSRRPRAPANACYRGETMRRVLNMEFVPC